jgi:hypothetical protein
MADFLLTLQELDVDINSLTLAWRSPRPGSKSGYVEERPEDQQRKSTVLAGFLESRLIDPNRSGAPWLKDFFSESLATESRQCIRIDFSTWLAMERGAHFVSLAEKLREWLPLELTIVGLVGDDLRSHKSNCMG